MTRFIFFLAFIIATQAYSQQLVDASLFSSNRFAWNPATTAPMNSWEAGLNYRQQWTGFNDAPRTAILSYQHPFIDHNMSIGVFIQHDNIHPLKANSISFTYAYKIKAFRYGQFSIGLLGTLSEYHVNSNNIVVNSFDDRLIPADETSQMIPNGGFGVYFQSFAENDFERTYFYVGGGINQFFKSNILFDSDQYPSNFKRAMHANAQAGVRVIQDHWAFEPSVWVDYVDASIYHTTAKLHVEHYETFWAALAYNSNRTAFLQVGLILKNGVFKDGLCRIGTQASYNLGKLGTYQGMTYEFFASYGLDLD